MIFFLLILLHRSNSFFRKVFNCCFMSDWELDLDRNIGVRLFTNKTHNVTYILLQNCKISWLFWLLLEDFACSKFDFQMLGSHPGSAKPEVIKPRRWHCQQLLITVSCKLLQIACFNGVCHFLITQSSFRSLICPFISSSLRSWLALRPTWIELVLIYLSCFYFF